MSAIQDYRGGVALWFSLVGIYDVSEDGIVPEYLWVAMVSLACSSSLALTSCCGCCKDSCVVGFLSFVVMLGLEVPCVMSVLGGRSEACFVWFAVGVSILLGEALYLVYLPFAVLRSCFCGGKKKSDKTD
mmetsp:Transcript_2657/g.5300  ORF Transcript_2657/g.5300 Transcript_2657/m.5300 type:complete len:130 (-) Transcript_2657:73-462(-)